MKRIFTLLLICTMQVLPALAQHKQFGRMEGRVIKILDGDTFDLLSENLTTRIRLHAIDAPEKKQAYSEKSRQALAALCFGKNVVVIVRGRDRYKRTIGDVYIGTIHINARMIELGMAWHFTRYSSDSTLTALEIKARTHRTGLWSDQQPIAPWEFRELKKAHRVQR